MQIMRDPVCLPTGQTYDRPCITRWLQQGNSSCPATGQALPPPVALVPNVALRGAIEEWAEKHAPWLLVRGGSGAAVLCCGGDGACCVGSAASAAMPSCPGLPS